MEFVDGFKCAPRTESGGRRLERILRERNVILTGVTKKNLVLYVRVRYFSADEKFAK